jgi:hypothetical protein
MAYQFTLLPPKDPSESVVINFDYAGELFSGETLESASVSISVHIGYDPHPELTIESALILGTNQVYQSIAAGVDGTTYTLHCSATTSLGKVLLRKALLAVCSTLVDTPYPARLGCVTGIVGPAGVDGEPGPAGAPGVPGVPGPSASVETMYVILGEALSTNQCFRLVGGVAFGQSANQLTQPFVDGVCLDSGEAGDNRAAALVQGAIYTTPLVVAEGTLWLSPSGHLSTTTPFVSGSIWILRVARSVSSSSFILDPSDPIKS